MAGRNLIVCCDGTWNTDDETDGNGLPVPTNVAKLSHVAIRDENQLVYYHAGVGTEGGWWARLRGGAMGVGLGENICSAYGWLATTYNEGDRIFIFGFSRGAYTARALAGMIGVCGLLDLRGQIVETPQGKQIRTLYDYYRRRDHADWNAVEGWKYDNREGRRSPKGTTPVHFVGVWDTVGSFGVPAELGLLRLVQWLFPVELHDNQLGDAVVHARHAVALDENRATFMPTLWDERPDKRGFRVETLKQVWFPGCHSDVGGGYGDSSLSDGALRWMIDEASALGLRVDEAILRPAFDGMPKPIDPNALGVLHQSVESKFKKLRTQHRPVPYLDVANTSGKLSQTSLTRLQYPTLRQGRYRPNHTFDPKYPVEILASQQWNETGIYLREGVTYKFTARGEWIDGSILCGPGGALSGQFHPGMALWALSSLLGWIEVGLVWSSKAMGRLAIHWFRRKRSPLKQTEFSWSPRVLNGKWFQLIGVIANGTTGDDSIFKPNQTLLIGSSLECTAERSGYLFCFANDAWAAYDNNHGSVWLTVEEIP